MIYDVDNITELFCEHCINKTKILLSQPLSRNSGIKSVLVCARE